MIPDGKNCHKFTKSGRVKNTKLLGKLRSEHESIPAAFEMKKSENADIWLGELCKNIKFRTKAHRVQLRALYSDGTAPVICR